MGDHNQDANSILAAMRHTECDCLIEMAQGDVETGTPDATAAVQTILGHRAILARASYFSALFQRSDPTRVLHHDDQGRRILRSVYRIQLPSTLNVDAVRSVVECLYRGRRSGRRDEQDIDPVDRIDAILFLGAPAHYIPKLVRNAVHALMRDISLAKNAADQPDGVKQKPRATAGGAHRPRTMRIASGGTHSTKAVHRDEADARLRLAWFVRRVADSDMTPSIKANVLAYSLHALPDAERGQIVDCHPRLVASIQPYRPEARVGDAHVDAQGRSWRALHLAFGYFGLAPASASAIVWQDLEFVVDSRFTEDDDGDVFKIYAQCRPHGETLDAVPHSDGEPHGPIHVEPRAARFTARTYCPVDGMRVKIFDTLFALCERDRLPRGAVSVPHALTRGWLPHSKLRRSCSSHCIYDVRHENSKRHDLLACEVDILVEEL